MPALTLPDSTLMSARLKRELSAAEVWGFAFVGYLVWIQVAPGVDVALGPHSLFLWIPIILVGILGNLQLKQLAAHWPDMSGGTPNYLTHLLKDYPWLGRYAAFGYFQGWASIPTQAALVLTSLIAFNLRSMGLSISELWSDIGFTLIGFIVAFSGMRALGILHAFFVIPAIGLLLVFSLHGLLWLGLAPDSPGLLPEEWPEVTFITWAKWWFLAVYAGYAIETATSFMADSQRPASSRRSLLVVAAFAPVLFIGGSWVLARLGLTEGVAGDDIFLILLSTANSFWGAYTGLLVTFLIVSSCLLPCAAGCANSPRVLYQLALDGQAAPVFGVVSHHNVPHPALVFTLLVSLGCLLFGDLTRVLMITGTGFLFSFIVLHFALWLNRGQPGIRWPWLWLCISVLEFTLFLIGGSAWGWQDFLLGLLFPAFLMTIDTLIPYLPWAPFHPAWWVEKYRARHNVAVKSNLPKQVTLLLIFICGAIAIGWIISNVTHGSLVSSYFFVIVIEVAGFLGMAAVGWTILPNIVAVAEAREQAVGEAQHLLKTALDAILVADTRGIIRVANPAAENIFMLPQERLQGRHLNELIPGVDTAIAKGEKRSEHVLTQADGSHRTVEVAIADISDSQMNERSIILHDVTERKQTEERLRRFSVHLQNSNRELEDFASVAAHDLQEPLRKIRAFGERLQSMAVNILNEQGLDYLQRMRDEAERMQLLITDLLALSRVNTRGRPFEKVDLTQIAKEVLSDLEVLIEKNKAQIELQALPTIMADPMQMRQLLQNLIGNALKFKGEAAPAVKISGVVAPDSTTCQILVADNGIGFHEKYLDRIFTAFERLHNRDIYEGTGIGLTVCRKIAERHNGSITAKSAPGMGATFIVTLPVTQLTGEQQ